jgi:signal transduction histidine kinase
MSLGTMLVHTSVVTIGPRGPTWTVTDSQPSAESRTRAVWPWTIAVAVAIALLPLAVWLNVLAGVPLLSHASGLQPDGVFIMSYALVGLVITHRVRDNWIGPLLCAIAVFEAAAGLATSYAAYAIGVHPGGLPFDGLAFKLSGPLFVTSYIAFTVWLPLLFPTGRVAAPAFRLVGWAGVAAIAAVSAGLLSLASWPPLAFFDGRPTPAFASTMFRISDDLQQILPWLALASLGVRYRTADRTGRRQLWWFTVAALSIAATTLNTIGSLPAWYDIPSQIPWIPLAIAFAILRRGLYDIPVLIRRSLVYTVLLATVLAIYVVVVEFAALAFDATGTVPALVATAVVALAVQPARARLDRLAERLVYGGRRDPGVALADVNARLRSSDSDDVLPALCAAVSGGARVPGAEIVLPSGSRASFGSLGDHSEHFVLVHAGTEVGRLVVGVQPGEQSLSKPERTVVAAVLSVVTAAVHAAALNEEVKRSRERLVSAREEERRRLRRDLHDGLGPALAGITLEIQAAQSLLDVDREGAVQMMQAAEGWARDAITEVRRVVYGLRPPVLDQLGLVRAVEEHAAAIVASPLRIAIRSTGELQSLPAAAEVATYLITMEALTNVVHHARATTCNIDLHASSDAVVLEVVDDGCGMMAGSPHGLGLTSMRERAEELGGTVVITTSVDGGTRVAASIPLGAS